MNQFAVAFVAPHPDPEQPPPVLQLEDDHLKPPAGLHPPLPADMHPFNLPGADLPPEVYDAYIEFGWKPQLTSILRADLGIPRERTLFVGDSSVDVRTARNAGGKVCGVTYGFQPESFEADPPDMMVSRPEELAQAVLAERRSRGINHS